MRRRTLLQAALAAPFAHAAQSHAQSPERRHRIGLLLTGGANEPSNVPGFIEELRMLGYEEGRNLTIERRYAGTSEEMLDRLARELVKANVEVIVAAGPSATRAAREATSTIPIVMGTHDPVELGLIASLAQPGGNMTGWCVLSADTTQKQFSLLKEAMPKLARAAILSNPRMAGHGVLMGRLLEGERAVGLQLTRLDITDAASVAPAFTAIRKERIEAFFVVPDPQVDSLARQIAAQAAEHRIPGMYTWRLYVRAGGLMSYGPSLPAMIRRWAFYVDKILKGARPADLPVETPRKYELILNQRAAQALGFTFPSALLLSADEVVS